MKNKMRKFFAVALAGTMLMSVVGCGESGKGESTETSETNTSVVSQDTETEQSTEKTYDEKVTFSITALEGEEAFGPEIDFIKEKFNIDFELVNLAESEISQKVRIWMATDSMPDVMMCGMWNGEYQEYLEWVEQGLVRELPDLSQWENISALVDEYEIDDYFKVDGKRYCWVACKNVDDPNIKKLTDGGYGFLYRRDWAEELGLANDDDVYTWEEFEEMAYAFVENNSSGLPTGTIGLGSLVAPHGLGIMMYSPYWETYVKQNDEYVWAMDLPETLEGIKWSNKLYTDGIIWKDHNVVKGADVENKFQNGEMGIIWHGIVDASMGRILNNMQQLDPEFDPSNDVRHMKVYGPDGKPWGQFPALFEYTTLFSPNLSDAEMERILDIFDWYLSDEGRDYYVYGMEGYNYTKSADGVYTKIEDTKRGNPFVTKNMIGGMKAKDTEKSRIETIGIDAVNLTNSWNDFMNSNDTSNLKRTDLYLQFFDGENYVTTGTCLPEGKERINQLIYSADPDDVESLWNEWKDSVRPDIEKVLEEINAQ